VEVDIRLALRHLVHKLCAGRSAASVRVRDLGRLSALGDRRLSSSVPVAVAVDVDSYAWTGPPRQSGRIDVAIIEYTAISCRCQRSRVAG
jgi:hypothetical protein